MFIKALVFVGFYSLSFASFDAHAVGYCRNCQTVHQRTPTLEESRKIYQIKQGCLKIEKTTRQLIANTESARKALDRIHEELQKTDESETSLRRKLLLNQKELTIQFLVGTQDAFEKNANFQEKWSRFLVEEEISYLTFVEFQMSVESMESLASHLEDIQRAVSRNMSRLNLLNE